MIATVLVAIAITVAVILLIAGAVVALDNFLHRDRKDKW